jgi:metallophosphoesterase (TIGR00282 family)
VRILFFGDIVGKSGRTAVLQRLPQLRERLDVDFVIANGENAAHGFGLTTRLCEELLAGGIDVVTLGNHSWDQREMIAYVDIQPKLLRPMNYPANTPGRGWGVFADRRGRKVLVVQAMGRLFMDPLDDPFTAASVLLDRHVMGRDVAATVVDFHAEATSEKMAFGHYLDGRASLVAGTHSHVPTADAQVLPKGTAYISDIGMCGDYVSVIGMTVKPAVERFITKLPTSRLEPAAGEGTVCAVMVETDDVTGLARGVVPLRLGGALAPAGGA